MIKVVEHALSVLALVAQRSEEVLTLPEVAEHLGVKKTTCSNILRTLVENNYLERVGPRGGYVCGPMLHMIGRRSVYQRHLLALAKPCLARLAQQTRANWTLAIMRNGIRYNIADAHKDTLPRVQPDVRESRDSVYDTSTARVLIAHMGEEAVRQVVAVNGPPPAEQWPAAAGSGLEAARRAIRGQGYELVLGDRPGMRGGAVPLWEGNKVIAALGFWQREEEWNDEVRQECFDAMIRAGNELSRRLTHGTGDVLGGDAAEWAV